MLNGIINLFEGGQEEISLFDPKYLEKIAAMPEVNLARKMLEKILNDQIRIYRKTNVVKSEQFSQLLNDTINNYINGHITNEDVINELIKMGKDIKQAQNEGEKLGLTTEEQAFYDAITKPEGIKDFYNNEELIKMTHELTRKLNETKTIDWRKKKSARAKMKVQVKRLLKQYDYPPKGFDEAMKTVLQQCELMADNL